MDGQPDNIRPPVGLSRCGGESRDIKLIKRVKLTKTKTVEHMKSRRQTETDRRICDSKDPNVT